MSQIFDALLRSEADRAGSEAATDVEATELLRHVEREAALRFTSETSPNEIESAVLAARRMVLDSVETLAPEAAKADTTSPNLSGEQSGLWNQFRSLPGETSSEGRLVCYTDRATPTAEAFRLLTVRLRELRQSRPLNKLLVTSTVPREGKSTVAANLACTLAQKKEEKVLLLEGDIRRPALSKIFNLERVSGICQVLQGSQTLGESILRLEGPGVWILPAGSTSSTPQGLLQSKKLPLLLDELANLFHWVIIDSPPVLPLADTSIWSQLADGILLVSRHGITEKKQLQRGLRALEQGKVIGALLNGCAASTYGDYYYASPDPTSAES